MKRTYIKKITSFILLTGFIAVMIGTSGFAYTDEEINEAIAELNGQIQNLKAGKDFDKSATVAGRAYISYTLDQMEDSKANGFDVTRVYLDFKKKLDRNVEARITTDIGRETYLTDIDTYSDGTIEGTSSDTRMQVYLKYAYFSLNNLGVPFIGMNSLVIGQSATHWIDFMQKYWKFRYVQKTLTDKNKIYSSADLGLAGLGVVDLTNFGLGTYNYHATLMNGEGYKKGETDNDGAKHFGIRIDTNPLHWGSNDKITLALGANVEDYPVMGGEREIADLENQLSLMGAWEFSKPGKGLVFAESFVQDNPDKISNGYSVGGQYEVIPDVVLFGRVDAYDPNTGSKANTDEKTLNIYGIEYNWGSNTKLALDLQNETTDGEDTSKTINFHTRIKW